MKKRYVAWVAMATSRNTKTMARRDETRRRRSEYMVGTTAIKARRLIEFESDSLTRPLSTKVDASING